MSETIVVFGCGYVGREVVRRLIADGHHVRASTTTANKLPDIEALGAKPVLLKKDRSDGYDALLAGANAVIHLAPVPDDLDGQIQAIAAAAPELRRYVYGSTTGAFGAPSQRDAWIDEATPSRDPGIRGAKRLRYERALGAAGLPLKVVRIAGIYGPHRTLVRSMARPSFVLFENGPHTSRTHVDDLSRLLIAMLGEDVPPLAIACDENPAPTLEVARFTCELLGRAPPEALSIDEARKVMSEAAIEMRLGGRRCRSLVREKLVGPLLHPTYVEGVKASLRAEGLWAG